MIDAQFCQATARRYPDVELPRYLLGVDIYVSV
jgi:hypothetical protein